MNSSATVHRCRIANNRAGADGGGFWIWGHVSGVVEVADCEILDNHAGDHGGGLYVSKTGASLPCHIIGNLIMGNTSDGAGVGETGSGGGIAALGMTGRISRNTIVGNSASGEVANSGGGILLFTTSPYGLAIRNNIIASNNGSGLTCRWEGRADFGPNLFWANDADIGDGPESCPSGWAVIQILADPLFCGPEVGNYRLRPGSPAVTGEGVMGAFPEVGCSPGVTMLGPGRWRRMPD